MLGKVEVQTVPGSEPGHEGASHRRASSQLALCSDSAGARTDSGGEQFSSR